MLKVTVGRFRKLQLLPYLKDNTLLTLSRKLHRCQKPITSLWTLSFLTVLFKLREAAFTCKQTDQRNESTCAAVQGH